MMLILQATEDHGWMMVVLLDEKCLVLLLPLIFLSWYWFVVPAAHLLRWISWSFLLIPLRHLRDLRHHFHPPILHPN